MYHTAAVLHKVKRNKGNDKKFHYRTGNDEDGTHEIRHTFNTIISYFNEGIVNNPFYLLRNIQLGLLILQLIDQRRRLCYQVVKISSQ